MPTDLPPLTLQGLLTSQGRIDNKVGRLLLDLRDNGPRTAGGCANHLGLTLKTTRVLLDLLADARDGALVRPQRTPRGPVLYHAAVDGARTPQPPAPVSPPEEGL